MEKELNRKKQSFELALKGKKKLRYFVEEGRFLVGSSETCNIILPFKSVSAIHAVLEVKNDKIKIFDMNSSVGTFVNKQKVVVSDLRIGDDIGIGNLILALKELRPEVMPPKIDFGTPDIPPEIESEKKLPKKLEIKLPKKKPDVAPRIEYPLAKDPRAEFSEYIFEDTEILYPIFKYQLEKRSIEVIILFNDQIYSVDYLPKKAGLYNLVGKLSDKKNIEYPYLGKNERCPFIEVSTDEILVHSLYGYDCLSLSDDSKNKPRDDEIVVLNQSDILRYSKDKIQIYVRNTERPPKVAPAPILRRDNDFKKYLFLVFMFVLSFLASMTMFEVDKEMEEEKNPERIATILYKKKFKLFKNKSLVAKKIDKTQPKHVNKVKKDASKQKQQAKAVKTGEKPKQIKKVKKAAVKKSTKDNKKTKVTKLKQTKSKKRVAPRKASRRKFRGKSTSKGHVDTYKALNLSSTVSNLLAKGGSLKEYDKVDNMDDSYSDNALDGGVESAKLKKATMGAEAGDLKGITKGKLDTSRGVKGLTRKKGIYTVGIPATEVLRGAMDPDVIRRILMDHIPQFRSCYQKVLERSKDVFNGIVPLNFTIGASGHVTKAGVRETTGEMPTSVRACVINVLRGIRFPEPLGGGRVEVNQPINFYPRVR